VTLRAFITLEDGVAPTDIVLGITNNVKYQISCNFLTDIFYTVLQNCRPMDITDN
jgi:hypothetical protein